MADGWLKYRQIERLASNVFARDMESLALGYLDLSEETVKSLRYENRGDREAFKRDILRKWANKNSGPDQVKVTL